jgi:nicotinamidase-related amidase
MAVYSLADEISQEDMATRDNAYPWDNTPPSRRAFVVVNMKNYFVQPKSSGGENPMGEIVPASNAWRVPVRGNGDFVIRIQNTTIDTSGTWRVRHEFKSSESARRRIAAMESCAKGHELWPTLEPHATDVFLTKKLHSASGPGSKRAVTSVCQ